MPDTILPPNSPATVAPLQPQQPVAIAVSDSNGGNGNGFGSMGLKGIWGLVGNSSAMLLLGGLALIMYHDQTTSASRREASLNDTITRAFDEQRAQREADTKRYESLATEVRTMSQDMRQATNELRISRQQITTLIQRIPLPPPDEAPSPKLKGGVPTGMEQKD